MPICNFGAKQADIRFQTMTPQGNAPQKLKLQKFRKTIKNKQSI